MARHSKVLQKMVDDNPVVFDRYSFEGEDGHWLYLNDPYRCSISEVGTIHDYTVKGCLAYCRGIEKYEEEE